MTAPASESFSMWTVYDHPEDFPHSFVARRWEISAKGCRPTQNFIVGPSLESVRACLPPDLAPVARSELDDPCIVETWL